MKKLIISILLILLPTLVFGIMGKVAEMSVILIAGIACAGVINMDKFSNFSIGTNGLEAQLKQAEEIISEAAVTIEDLKSFIEPLLNANINLIIYDGILDGMEFKAKEETILELYTMKKKQNLNIDNEQFIKALKMLASHYFIDLKMIIRDEGFDRCFGKYARIDSMFKYPKFEEIEEYLNSHKNLINDKVEKSLENYKRFCIEILEPIIEESL
ncbi:hypothetical protein NSQ89_12855 [Niallia sp. FSL R7-0648]|uniref:hypothetical protein n=1 Tax=Niallia sp. FSL R7-0648 TaxID=2954521 RepID=UPI0030FC9955